LLQTNNEDNEDSSERMMVLIFFFSETISCHFDRERSLSSLSESRNIRHQCKWQSHIYINGTLDTFINNSYRIIKILYHLQQ